MKGFLPPLVIISIILGVLTIDRYTIISECSEKNGVSEADYRQMLAGDFTNLDSEKHQCFAHCLLEMNGIFKNGQYQKKHAEEKLLKVVEKAIAELVINTCGKEKGANDCETAYKISKCYHKLIPN